MQALKRSLSTAVGTMTMTGMAAKGEYAANSLSQQAAFQLVLPHVKKALDSLPLSNRRAVIADYGAADGAATRMLAETLPKDSLVSVDLAVQDLRSNDWEATSEVLSPLGSLVHNGNNGAITHLLPTALPESGARIFSAPGSFHDQVLPDASVDVAVSGTALHWLSDTSGLPRIKESVINTFPRVDPTAAQAWATHAADDWVSILSARAAELKPGGTFAAVIPTIMADRSIMYQVVFEVLDELITDREKRGVLAAGFKERFSIPARSRSYDDIAAGFDAVPSLELLEIEQKWLRNPYFEDFDVEIQSAEGRAAFADRYTASIYGWCGPMIESAVVGNDEQARFRSDLSAALAARAHELEWDYAVALVLAKKR